MAKILLVRHGHVEGIKPERFRGRQALSLTERGRAEAAADRTAYHASPPPGSQVSSTRARLNGASRPATPSRKTATSQRLSATISTISIMAPGNSELTEEMQQEDPQLFAAWFATPHLVRFPRGESLQDIVARSADAFRLVIARHPESTVVLVSHDNINRALLLQLLDQPLSAYRRLPQDPCCINEIDFIDGQVRVSAYKRH